MNIKAVNRVYFIGIGGIGMSALARWFMHNSMQVVGYDKTNTALTETLKQEGLSIHFTDEVQSIPQEYQEPSDETLIVYTPAIPKEHKQFNYFKEKGHKVFKRAEVLGLITKGLYTLAVAGTHGKTTTSTILAHLLRASGKNVAAFLGGISANYNTNMLVNTGSMEESLIVVEADEYDRSFLQLHPNMAIVTSMDADHLDIYGQATALEESFRLFLDNVNANGQVFIQSDQLTKIEKRSIKASVNTYGLQSGNWQAENITVENGSFIFDMKSPSNRYKHFEMPVPGFHNVENAVAALAIALTLGVDPLVLKKALKSFIGVKRRFEYIIKEKDFVFIDDYAHHPSEIAVMIDSVKELYPDMNVTVVFQPHLYSRTRDFASEFSKSLSKADEVYLLPIYPAREEAIEGVSSEMLIEGIAADTRKVISKEDLLALGKTKKDGVFITLGAGDIDALVSPLKENFLKTYA